MSWWMQGLLYGVLLGCAIVWVVSLFRSGKPIRRVLGSTLQGACALAAVNVSGAITGVSLGLGWFSWVTCAVLGVPGVIGLLLLKCICEM